MYTPQRLFGEVESASDILSHEPFLERARLQREQEREGSARLALGAYVVARLVDKLLSIENQDAAAEGFRWQLEAVRRHIGELPPDSPETAHLAGVVAAVPAAGSPGPSLWMSLTAYAYFLEHEGRLEESLEMLSQAAHAQGRYTTPADFTAYALFAGRLNRLLARWEVASTCYGAAEETGSKAGDAVSKLRGQLGRGAVHRGQGNYPAARAAAETVLHQATELQLTEVQAMAYADLGAIYGLQGLRLNALEAEYQAFRLSCALPQQMRALANLALGLYEIGAFEAARLAFQIAIESDASVEVRVNAMVDLMDLESSVGNRVSFERYRNTAADYLSRMTPSMCVDYHYKVGIGLTRFGKPARARASFTTALALSEQHKLHAYYFKIEEALHQLEESPDQRPTLREASELSQAPSVREMENGLREYAAASAV